MAPRFNPPWSERYVRQLQRLKDAAEVPTLAAYEGRGFIAEMALQLLVTAKGGTWKALWWHFRHVIQYKWMHIKTGVWHWWHYSVLLKTQEQISEMVDAEYGITPQETAAAQKMIDEADNGTTKTN